VLKRCLCKISGGIGPSTLPHGIVTPFKQFAISWLAAACSND